MSEEMDFLEEEQQLVSADHFPGTILLTCGTFDLFHYGHLAFLQNCLKIGADHMIIGMNSDYSVKSLKGNKRPIIPEYERKQMLLALPFVDDVFVFDDEDACKLIRDINPSYFAKGIEYVNKDIPEFDVCRELGTQIVVIDPEPYTKDIHTSALIRRIIEREILG
jgi:rfaE bifunctional protein nucleotidyltransferase chain/domain